MAAKRDRRRIIVRLIAVGTGLFLAIQLVPYGWWHENPRVVEPASWPDPQAEAIARASCYDCHSHETRWPLYSYVRRCRGCCGVMLSRAATN